MNETLNNIYSYIIPYAINIISAVLIFIIGKWVARIASNLFEKAMETSKVEKTLTSFAKNMIYYSILIFVIIAALGKLGIQTNSFIAMIGAAGLAVGLALQGSLANFAAGVMIILFEPFKTGDTIETSGATGKVEEIQIFSTIMTSTDNKKIIIPNAKITGDKIIVFKK
ncbi:mechanosensitive ion channel protein [Candidatus Omnitrophus magneticus]|uniref:Mechanosensitive ion channel protein n=1 Tax=Candidatus Omnitrophus magneticus TaxID=1609969 RepID=A0A0F0CJU9_9BACT|nr:mechanosensitive ion channel protein [Candidatus Omnitrophus magneticus]KJJ85727.1 mechanosensitive ion channel protein [Candidatus Omnitrophus magneticus]